jgi:hypothetical protein
MPPQYNPDVYEPAEGCRKVKQEQREKKLVEYTKWAIKHAPNTISVETQASPHPSPDVMSDVLYLFYDGYTKGEWERLI